MPVLRAIRTLATCRADGGQAELHVIHDAAMAFRDGVITWVGPETEIPVSEDDGESWDAGRRLVIPGLIDAHTHLGFGGWRADEFTRRIRGESYAQIAASGGGIASTVAATRTMGEASLLSRCRDFLTQMASLGVTTVEAKSGYGLDRETELRLLRCYDLLGKEGLVRVVPTYLGAHVVPPEHRADRNAYVDRLCAEMIPLVGAAKLARFCDVFVEDDAFSPAEARRIAVSARGAGLALKLHADQLTDGGGAALAAELGAVSADHLEQISPEGIAALAQAGTVAVTLPIATLYLQQSPPPARALIAAGVPVVIATDFNPGTAPSLHLPLALTLACVGQRMTPAEALKGATIFAARAVDAESEIGSLQVGKAADFAVVDAPDVDHWLYQFRANACVLTARRGRVTSAREEIRAC